MRQNKFRAAFRPDILVYPPQVKEFRLVQVCISYERQMTERRLPHAAENGMLVRSCHRAADLDAHVFLFMTIFAGILDIDINTLKVINLNPTFVEDTLEWRLRQCKHFSFPALPTLLFPATAPKVRRVLLN